MDVFGKNILKKYSREKQGESSGAVNGDQLTAKWRKFRGQSQNSPLALSPRCLLCLKTKQSKPAKIEFKNAARQKIRSTYVLTFFFFLFLFFFNLFGKMEMKGRGQILH